VAIMARDSAVFLGLRNGALLPLALLSLLLMQGLRTGGADAAGITPKKVHLGRCDHSAFRVVVDVGHTPEAPGAVSARGVPEYDFNLRLAKQIEEKLTEGGFTSTILLITEGSAKSGLSERVARANALNADLFVSIHHDSVPQSFKEEWEHDGQKNSYSDRFKGHSIFVSYENRRRAASCAFARLLGRELKASGLQYTPHYSRPFMGKWRRELIDADAGVYRYDALIVLRITQMPAVLLEAGSIVNRDEELLLSSSDHGLLIATSVVNAVDRFCALRPNKNSNARLSELEKKQRQR
jgi:N-acetylmuramoyl-L-alanine amidase